MLWLSERLFARFCDSGVTHTDLSLVGLRTHLQITEVLTVCINGIFILKRACL